MASSDLKTKKTKKSQNTKTENVDKLKTLVTIIPAKKAEYYIDYIQSFGVNLQCSILGYGTSPVVMDQINEVSRKKVVIFSFIKENQEKEILYSLEEKFNIIRNGRGIAFTIPMNSVMGVLFYGFLSDNRKLIKGGSDNE